MKALTIPVLVFVLASTLLLFSSVDAFLVGRSPKFAYQRPKTRRMAAVDVAPPEEESKSKKVPIHLLAGFLGSGKTTTLKHVLENNEGARVGVIVNDVASVNIDAKLVSKQNKVEGVVELQNGCACCSISEEFMGSIETIINTSKDDPYDAIIVELSGVADPVAIQNNWKQAVQDNLSPKVTNSAALSNIITVIDACTFGSDYMTWDAAGDRKNWIESPEDCTANRKVVELLAEQVEAADILILNKQDMASPDQLAISKSMAAGLNDKAEIVTTTFGKVKAKQILEKAAAASKSSAEEDCTDPDCTDNSHSHSHDHDCAEPDCTDSSHSHSHQDHDCQDPACTDTSHSHSHKDHNVEGCADPDCTDTSHSHSHDHQSSSSSSTSTDNLGISNFVYKATRPFHMDRLMQLLYLWPVPVKDELDLGLLKEASEQGFTDVKGQDGKSPFAGVLRSKGFCWFAPSQWEGLLEDAWRHNLAMYWSHAGKHIGIQEAGRFWASLPEERMVEFFADNPSELERIKREDFVSEEWGDRRQEIVFIGVDLNQDVITKALDDCLLTDDEMETYREQAAMIEVTPQRIQ